MFGCVAHFGCVTQHHDMTRRNATGHNMTLSTRHSEELGGLCSSHSPACWRKEVHLGAEQAWSDGRWIQYYKNPPRCAVFSRHLRHSVGHRIGWVSQFGHHQWKALHVGIEPLRTSSTIHHRREHPRLGDLFWHSWYGVGCCNGLHPRCSGRNTQCGHCGKGFTWGSASHGMLGAWGGPLIRYRPLLMPFPGGFSTAIAVSLGGWFSAAIFDADDCDPNCCQHAGTCIDGTSSYICNCWLAYTGAHCEALPACLSWRGRSAREPMR